MGLGEELTELEGVAETLALSEGDIEGEMLELGL